MPHKHIPADFASREQLLTAARNARRSRCRPVCVASCLARGENPNLVRRNYESGPAGAPVQEDEEEA